MDKQSLKLLRECGEECLIDRRVPVTTLKTTKKLRTVSDNLFNCVDIDVDVTLFKRGQDYSLSDGE